MRAMWEGSYNHPQLLQAFSCHVSFFLSLLRASLSMPQPKSSWDGSRSTETARLGAPAAWIQV